MHGKGFAKRARGIFVTPTTESATLIRLFHMANLDHVPRARARELRKNDTEAERRLWEALRARRLGGYKFVRQLPLEPYIADFACRQDKLIVEIDGATHSSDEELAYDSRRTRILERQGWRILRATNHDVFTNRDGVCETILMALTELK
jgi:very-short-patch-repair endonuclease